MRGSEGARERGSEGEEEGEREGERDRERGKERERERARERERERRRGREGGYVWKILRGSASPETLQEASTHTPKLRTLIQSSIELRTWPSGLSRRSQQFNSDSFRELKKLLLLVRVSAPRLDLALVSPGIYLATPTKPPKRVMAG